MHFFLIYHRQLFAKKNAVVFKHIRFKSTANKNLNSKDELNFKDVWKTRVKIISKIFDCSDHTAQKIILKNNNIIKIYNEDLTRNASFCNIHFKFSELVELPFLLSMNSSVLQHRYHSLKELGCFNITASAILRFSHLIKKTPTMAEKEGHFHFKCQLDYYLDFLGPVENKCDIKNRLLKMYKNGRSLAEIKETMNAEFLSARLNCSLSRVHLMFRLYPLLKLHSVLNTGYLLDMLLNNFNFPINKIYQNPSVLSLHHEAVEHFLNKIPNILGISMSAIINQLPVILRRPIDSVQKVHNVLQQYNITDKQLQCCLKVLTFSPVTIKARLDYLCKSQEFSSFKSYKKFLWLVYYYSNLRPRLEAMKTCDISFSISMFTVSKPTFEKYLCFTRCRSHITDICSYLAGVFSYGEKEILLKLKDYPFSQNVSLANCNLVVNFLLQAGVTKKQLFNGLGIIFYNIDIVKVYFNDLKDHSEYQPFSEWTSHYNLIQLLIYSIEVDFGFHGSRLYKEKCKLDDMEPILVSCQSF